MRKTTILLLLSVALAGCSSHSRKDEMHTADEILAQADSLENTVYTYADTLALQHAIAVYERTGQTARKTKAVYHLGKAYLVNEQDSAAYRCFRQAADEFLALSDSVYFPLSILEMSLIAENCYNSDANTTMLNELRSVQREMIRGKKEGKRKQWLWWLVMMIVLTGGGAGAYFIYKRKEVNTTRLTSEDMERNIELLLSQGNIKATLNWHDYSLFSRTANAYLYNVVDKLQATGAQLTEQDIRFMVLVLLDLPAKEIADIMNLSQNSISNKKTRTAQKLGTIAAELRKTIISLTLNS